MSGFLLGFIVGGAAVLFVTVFWTVLIKRGKDTLSK